MKIKYVNWNPHGATLKLVAIAERIINEYQADGYVLTLRQLYYQFVARGLIENSEKSYKNLGSVITKARMSGFISWEAIEDRARTHHTFWSNESARDLVEDLSWRVRFDQWKRQGNYVEVWVEKEALGNVIERACNPYLVPYMACKGYLSASEAWRAGQRFQSALDEGKRCTLIHLGDHDPSGIDMTRDNESRLSLFSEYHEGVIDVKRIALNMDQVEKYDPPPNPAKITDTRAKKYIRKHGSVSWELDALEPSVLEKLITDEITSLIDQDMWDEVIELEHKQKEIVRELGESWDQVMKHLGIE